MATIYIAPTGQGSADGTSEANAYAISSINNAETDAGSGGTILFADGDYTFSANQTWDAGGHANLTYKSLNLHGAKIKGTSLNAEMRRLTIGSSTTNTLKLDGFHVENFCYISTGGTTITITNFNQVDTHNGFRGLFYTNGGIGQFSFSTTEAHSITNSVFSLYYGNTFRGTGTISNQQGQDKLFENCTLTIVKNCTFLITTPTIIGTGGQVADSSNQPTIKNTILMSDNGNQIASSAISMSKCSNCCIFQMHSNHTTGGTNNVFSDPLFIDQANGDYRLRPSSPCINTGTSS